MTMATVQRRQPAATSVHAAPADLEQAMTDLGLYITKADDDEVWSKCPMHAYYTGKEDGNPSWSVNRVTGYHSCFSCPFGGSWIELVCELLECGPFEAARWTNGYGLNTRAIEELPAWEDRHEEPARKRSREVGEEDLAQFSTPPPEAIECRDLTLEAVRHFGVLWEPSSVRWVFPIRMADGRLIGWQYKGEHRLRGGNRSVENWPKRVAKSKTLFGADIFPTGAPAVVLEGPHDPVRLYVAGMEGGVSTWGDKFSDEQMRVLRDLTDEVVWASDNDDAGKAAARLFRDGDKKTKRPAFSRRFSSRFLDYEMLPDGAKDIGTEGVADTHILRAVRAAKHSLLADLGESSTDDVHRGDSRLPGSRNRDNARSWQGSRGVRTRLRQDDHGHLRNRKPGRGVR